MKYPETRPVVVSVVVLALASLVSPAEKPLAAIQVDYPSEGAIFPSDMAAPTFLWHDSVSGATAWHLDVISGDGSIWIRMNAAGEHPRVGDIDPRCVSTTNELPKLAPDQADARTWGPDADTWEAIKKRSVGTPATVTITGYRAGEAVSRGRISIRTSADPVGAPIFYRDVPLMPSELQKGVIKPISPKLLPYIAWRLRYVGEPRSRVVMEGLHTCANCHSFSQDGKTLGLDLDGPHNDKGLYAIVPISQRMSIRNDNVISWKSFRNQTAPDKRIGFMSQVSPDGRYVVTATQVEYYVANFKDYRFLQVFYPTRGILAWYNRADGRMHALPGADDARYVQANAVWSPDGKYLVFARAEARDAYPEGRKVAESANDPNEVPIQYDLYRIPFNDGRGGRAEPIAGASRNGMSNSFPKVSPDGRWIVYVQSRNGQLMRPDGKLYIVPAAGGEARRMTANTPLMNSWHSFSPNGRWLVFSSKSRSPYTQMFLTHIDDDGRDSPAILIENSTAANRAVNIPEFVNVPADGMLSIDAPAAEFYRLYDAAWDFTEKGQVEAAITAWKKALEVSPDDDKARSNLGGLLLGQGKTEEASTQFRMALAANPDSTSALDNLGLVFMQKGQVAEAIARWRQSVAINPTSTEPHANLGIAFMLQGKFGNAIGEWRAALNLEPGRVAVLGNLAWMLATCPDSRLRDGGEAVKLAEQAVRLAGDNDPVRLDTLGAAYAEAGRFPDAILAARRALVLARKGNDPSFVAALDARIALYTNGKAYRETR